MKILYLVHQFYPEYQSGTEKVILNQAIMAQRNGLKVKVISYSFYPDAYYDNENNGILYKEHLYKGIPVLAFKYKLPPINLHISLESEALHQFARKIIDVEAPDIIHVGHPMRVHEFIQVAREKNIPYLVTLTDFFFMCPKVILAPDRRSLCSGPQKGAACRDLCGEFSQEFIQKRLGIGRSILQNAKAIVSPSKFLANLFTQEFDGLKIQIIYHGIQHKYIKPNDKVYSGKKSLVFGYAGSLAYHKGVHVLLKAFEGIKDENLKLVLYGSGEESYVKQLKDIAGKDRRVSFAGIFSEEQVGDVYSKIDVIVTPSTCYESYLLVLHEALASNVPVIASNLGGMAEKIKDGFNGYTFIPGVSNDLRRKMELIIHDTSILDELKSNIRNKMVIPVTEQESYQYYRIYKSIYRQHYDHETNQDDSPMKAPLVRSLQTNR